MPASSTRLRRRKRTETILDSTGIVLRVSRVIVIIRMVLAYPVISSWFTRPISPYEPIALACLAIASLAAFVYWTRVLSFIVRHPIILTLDIILSVLFMGGSGPQSPYFLYLGATAVLIGILYSAKSRVILTAILLMSFVLLPKLGPTGTFLPALDLSHVLTWTISLLMLLVLVYLGSTLHNLQDRIDNAVELAMRNAREGALGEERSRIARELHDSTMKTLNGISMLSASIERNPASAKNTSHIIRQAADTAAIESRRLVTSLHQNSGAPFASTLRDAFDELQVIHGIPIHFCTEGSEVPSTYSYTTRKIIEEAVSNAAQHSGTARIDVKVACSNDFLTATITDFGCGFRIREHKVGHIGLTSMRERSAEIGGILTIKSVVNEGTTVTMKAPLNRSCNNE